MVVHQDRIGAQAIGSPFSWDERDALLYAVSVGAGLGGDRELRVAVEGTAARALDVLPGFATILAMRAACSPLREVGDFPPSCMVHAGQRIELPAALPARGRAIGTGEVTDIRDTGEHARIETTTRLVDADSGQLLATTTSIVVLRGQGGFGGDAPAPSSSAEPNTKPDGVRAVPTAKNQALLYRLNGDRNPLHADPEVARSAGFPAPILHGLCTLGFAALSVTTAVLDGEAGRVTGLEARFRAPVVPGAVLETRWWRVSPGRTLFRTEVDGSPVLDRGVLTHQAA